MPTLRYPQHPAVVVAHLAGRAHEEIRGNQAAGTCELPLPTLDLPGHGSLLEARLGAGTEVALSDGAEEEPMAPLPKSDAADAWNAVSSVKVIIDSKAA